MFIFELDEKQHFNEFRYATLECYPSDLTLGYSIDVWKKRCLLKKRLEAGGFAKPKPPLFPGQNGRHRQRAFRDSLTDILPIQYEYLPTLRIGDIEAKEWLNNGQIFDILVSKVRELDCR